MPEAYHPPFESCFAASLIGLPQAVHFVFRKNCGSPQRLFSQRTMTDLPQASHFSLPTKVSAPQKGQATVNDLPQPEQTALPR
jgi:hypothetical protein